MGFGGGVANHQTCFHLKQENSFNINFSMKQDTLTIKLVISFTKYSILKFRPKEEQ